MCTKSIDFNSGGHVTALRRTVLPFAGFAVVIAAWRLTATTGITGKEVPTPGEVFAAAWEGLREPEGLLVDIRLSVLRVLIGVAVGCALSLPVGFALAWFPTLRAMFDPIINFCRALPPIALSPLVIIYVGIGEEARLLVLVWAAFFASVVVLYEGIAAVEDIYVRAGRALGASDLELFRRVIVPATVPQMFVAVRVALGVSWATLVAAELIAAQRGLGWTIQRSASFFRTEEVYAGILLIGFCALLMDMGVRLVQARAVSWQERVVR
jgi:NitT/TauT family transport system permease protein